MKIEFDSGFQFGLGAFETIAVENGRPVFLERHLRRLKKAAEFLKLGSLKDRGADEDSVKEYLQKNRIDRGALKIILSEENSIMTIRKNPYTEESYRQGFRMDFSSIRRNESSPFIYHKTLNYGDCIFEKRAAAAAGMNERIFLNTKEQICEGTVSNIFFVYKNRIVTPETSSGLLQGIMREYLIDTYNIEEMEIYPAELKYYEECFVTNSLMGIMPVVQLGEKKFTERHIADKLRKEYANEILR